MLNTEYYFKAPVAYEAVTPDPRSEWEFEDFCTWVTRRVPDALVYNTDGGSGTGPTNPDPFEWHGTFGLRIEHPLYGTFDFFGGPVAFVDGWFEPALRPPFVQYPTEWNPESHAQEPESAA